MSNDMSFYFIIFCIILSIFNDIIIINGELHGSLHLCDKEPCIIMPKQYKTKNIVCQNRYDNCVIYCISPNQCNNMTLYSGSKNTILYCTNINSCQDMNMYIGSTNNILNEIDNELLSEVDIEYYYDFIGDKTKFLMNCDYKESCLNTNINIDGYFETGIEINALNYRSLYNSNINVKLFELQTFDVHCGDSNQFSCNNMNINCINGICNCDGDTCPVSNQLLPTYPPSPTPAPTILPECINKTSNNDIINPGVLTCTGNSDPCILVPTQFDRIVICPNSVETCIIDCKEKRQCWHDLTIYSGSINTIAYCSSEESCKNTHFYIGIPNMIPYGYSICDFYGEKHSFKVDCNSESSCENCIFDINGEFKDDIIIESLGEESMRNSAINAKIDSNNLIYLHCGDTITDACVQTIYQCQTGNCKCDGDTCPNIISASPTITPTLLTNNPTSLSPTLSTAEPTGTRNPTPNSLSPTFTPTKKPTGPTVEVYPNGEDTIICTNEVDYCIINCIEPQQCKISDRGLYVYSAAKYTIIKCIEEDSCTEAKFFIGIPKQLPPSYLLMNFEGKMNEVIIDCSGKAACQNVIMQIDGYIKNGLTIHATGLDSFEEGLIDSVLVWPQETILNCGDDQLFESCSQLTFNCVGKCTCNGNACYDAVLNFRDVTNLPTIDTLAPIKPPTYSTPNPTKLTLTPTVTIVPNGQTNLMISDIFGDKFGQAYPYIMLIGCIILSLIMICCCCMRCAKKRTKYNKDSILMDTMSTQDMITMSNYGTNNNIIDDDYNDMNIIFNDTVNDINNTCNSTEYDQKSTEL